MMLYGGCGVPGCLDCEPVVLVAEGEASDE